MNSSHAMKTCVLILLVVLLCAERAQGLSCYQCLGVTPETSSETSCQPATCQFPDGVCITQEFEAILDSYKEKRMNKFCLPRCPENQSKLGNILSIATAISSKISCCKEDLCN